MEHEQIHLDPVQREAIKAYKESKDRFKKDIATMADAQRQHSKHRSGEYSQQEQSRAQQAHAITRRDLRAYYIAYATFRTLWGGYKKFPEAPGYMDKVNNDYIKTIIQTYAPKTIYTG